MWDVVEMLTEENEKIKEKIPSMEKTIEELEGEIRSAQMQNRG